MALNKIRNNLEFRPMPNIAILFETFHNALAHDVSKKFDDVTDTWMETKDAIENFRIATKDILRVRGETAKRIDEKEFWKQLYEKEKEEKEQSLKQIQEIQNELTKVKDDKKVKNEYILYNNGNLVRKLHREKNSKLNLIEELLDPNSRLNEMNLTQRNQLLMKMRLDCITDIEKSKMLAEDRTSPYKVTRSRTFVSSEKSAFV